MKNKKPIAINFFGGPGAGKSSMAAGVFSNLKSMNYDVELVTEFAKDKVWEEAYKVFEYQFFVCANQAYKMFVVSQHVKMVITDSPIIMGCAYNKGDNMLDAILKREYDKYNNINILLKRVKEYNTKGRYQTERQAKQKDTQIKEILKKNKIEYKEYDGNYDSIPSVVNYILYCVNRRKNENN